MSIASEITRLQQAKADIKAAIETKGVTVGDITLDNYAAKVLQIPTGITPTGTINITTNGIQDVTNYANANVQVPIPVNNHNAYKVANTAAMNQLTGMSQDDVCVVHENTVGPMTQATSTNIGYLTFPANVTLSSAVTSNEMARFKSTNHDVRLDLMIDATSVDISYDNMTTGDYLNIRYTSNDGINYTMQDPEYYQIRLTGQDVLNYEAHEPWQDLFGYFLYTGAINFEGIYQYKGQVWGLLNTGLTADDTCVYEKTFMGMNGVDAGTLGNTVALTFDDIVATLYEKAQETYDGMAAIVLPARSVGYFSVNSPNIVMIPDRRDGTSILDTSNVTDASGLFNSCRSLRYVGKFELPQTITNLNSFFSNCTSLKKISLFDTSNVTDMTNMFGGCGSLTSIPLLDTSNVITMRSMFWRCTNLTAVPQLDTSNVTDMQGTFNACTNLVHVPRFNWSKVTNLASAFSECRSLDDTSLDNILLSCISAVLITSSSSKKLTNIGFRYMETTYPASRIQALPHYQAFINAGWSIGY